MNKLKPDQAHAGRRWWSRRRTVREVGMAGIWLACTRTGRGSEIRQPVEQSWSLVLEEPFTESDFLKRWMLEGEADLDVRSEGGRKFLRIQTRQSVTDKHLHHSVLWFRERLAGDLRFVFRARGQKGNGTIFYMNARTVAGSPYKSIFDWKRPDALEERYSASPDFEAYTFGYLRSPECNLRHVGGVTAAAWPKPWNQETIRRYERESILLSLPSPFGDNCDQWHDFDLRIVGSRISGSVDGMTLFDMTDEGKTPRGTLRWTPLTGGGWAGFRNFRASWIDVEFVRVYRLVSARKP